MAPRAKISPATAAKVLRCHEDEVLKVDGDVVTTFDGQRYRLTGSNPGDYAWLKNGEEIEAPVDEDVQV